MTPLHAALSALRDIPITVSVQRAAFAAMRTLAQRGGLQHQLPLPDLLIARCSTRRPSFAVMHYDHHFDRLADVPQLREPLDRAARHVSTQPRAQHRGRALAEWRPHAASHFRGANTVAADAADPILDATEALMRKLLERQRARPRRTW